MMHGDDLDRILASDEELVPSSDFAIAVMDAVRREAAAPPPIPFPWRRAIPGIAAVVAILASIAAGLVQFLRTPFSAADPSAMFSSLKQLIDPAVHYGVGWIAIALLLSLSAAALSTRLSKIEV
jgi:hypothetical protein